jgi:hypothetical protein
VVGGTGNTASGDTAIVAGGSINTASGACSAILGGSNNAATCNFAMVIGCGLTSDKTNTTFVNQLSIKNILNESNCCNLSGEIYRCSSTNALYIIP